MKRTPEIGEFFQFCPIHSLIKDKLLRLQNNLRLSHFNIRIHGLFCVIKCCTYYDNSPVKKNFSASKDCPFDFTEGLYINVMPLQGLEQFVFYEKRISFLQIL